MGQRGPGEETTLQSDSETEVWDLGTYLSRRRTRVRPGAGTRVAAPAPPRCGLPAFQRSQQQPQDGRVVQQATGGGGVKFHHQPPHPHLPSPSQGLPPPSTPMTHRASGKGLTKPGLLGGGAESQAEVTGRGTDSQIFHFLCRQRMEVWGPRLQRKVGTAPEKQ